MAKIFAEYIWIDGASPVPRLRSKTKVLTDVLDGLTQFPVNLERIPVWGFDGSSTEQADGEASDCVLEPVRVVVDPLRENGLLVLCEVFNSHEVGLAPNRTNNRAETREVADKFVEYEPLFGIEQEYTFFKGNSPLGWPNGGYPAPQGPFYCGVGADEVFGRDIVEEHMQVCLQAGLMLSGVNAEVMPGQWEFQIGPGDPLLVSDHLWLARYLLYRVAEKYDVNVKLSAKPVEGDWNGAGAHTNFSTIQMRSDGGEEHCIAACEALGKSFEEIGFPYVYGYGYQNRLTGAHETCSYKEFKYGVADRTASVRIPLHVKRNGSGYIEDRRPCANIDPYQVCTFLIRTICE